MPGYKSHGLMIDTYQMIQNVSFLQFSLFGVPDIIFSILNRSFISFSDPCNWGHRITRKNDPSEQCKANHLKLKDMKISQRYN